MGQSGSNIAPTPPEAPKPTAADCRPAAGLERDPHGCYNPASCEVHVVVADDRFYIALFSAL